MKKYLDRFTVKQALLPNSIVLLTILAGCAGIKTSPPYDAWESNPRHATVGNQYVAFSSTGKRNRSAESNESANGASESETSTENLAINRASFEKWKAEKSAKSSTYEEFLEYREWKEFQRLKKEEN